MKCMHCGNIIPDGSPICPYCGITITQTYPQGPVFAQNGVGAQGNTKKQLNKTQIAVIAAAAVLLIVGVWFFWFNPGYASYAKEKCGLPTDLTLYVGESYDFALDNRIRTSDKSVLQVDGSSVVGVSPGEVVVKSSVFPYVSSCTVSVIPETVAFTEGDRFWMYVTQTLTPEIRIDGITEKKDVTWSSDDTDVATVDENGTVSGLSEGTVTVTATLPGGSYAACTVEVKPDAVVIDDHGERSIATGETVTIGFHVEGVSTEKDVTWVSTNPAVATVDDKGTVRGVTSGTVSIVANLPNKESDSCLVVVKPDTVSVVEPASPKVVIGTPVTLDVKIVGLTEKKDVKWRSDDTAIATVDGNGKVSGVEPGTVTITAELPNGEKDSYRLTVEPPVVSQQNGFIKWPSGSRIAPVKVNAPSDASCYVYFKSRDNSSNDFSLFVNAGTTTSVNAPTGSYDVYYASGETWYGTKYKFGYGTGYYHADSVFKFYTSGDRVYGTELTLYLVADGNLNRENISESEFPG